MIWGRTIRKASGGVGGGDLRAAGIIFRYQISFMNFFFRPWHEYFLGLIGVHEFFFISFSLARIFFLYFARPPPSPPP